MITRLFSEPCSLEETLLWNWTNTQSGNGMMLLILPLGFFVIYGSLAAKIEGLKWITASLARRWIACQNSQTIQRMNGGEWQGSFSFLAIPNLRPSPNWQSW